MRLHSGRLIRLHKKGSAMAEDMRRGRPSHHGSGKDLFPETRRTIEGGSTSVANSGARERWDSVPAWYGLAYGKGRRGSARKTVVPRGVTAWPISPRTTETKRPDAKKLGQHVRFLRLRVSGRIDWRLRREGASACGLRNVRAGRPEDDPGATPADSRFGRARVRHRCGGPNGESEAGAGEACSSGAVGRPRGVRLTGRLQRELEGETPDHERPECDAEQDRDDETPVGAVQGAC
jgi:hypothetical protein